MESYLTLQPSARVDHITGDGRELTQLPYPFHVDAHGEILRQDFWRGNPVRVIGFQKRVDVQRIDRTWHEIWERPELAVNMYAVTADERGKFSTQTMAIQSCTAHDGSE